MKINSKRGKDLNLNLLNKKGGQQQPYCFKPKAAASPPATVIPAKSRDRVTEMKINSKGGKDLNLNLLNKKSDQQQQEQQPYCIKPKAAASPPATVIPAKRRSVKRIILNDFVQFVSSLFKTKKKPKPPPKSNKKKTKEIVITS